jgi:hypothetical protein
MPNRKKRQTLLIWTAIIIPILGIIPAYYIFFNGDKDSDKENGVSTQINIDSSTISGSNIVSGDNNNVNSNNSTNFTTINNYYSVSDITIKSENIADIKSDDKAVYKRIYHGTETFVVCKFLGFYTFKFTCNLKNAKPGKTYTIKWGDGTLDTTVTAVSNKVQFSHTFPRGNSIMQIETQNQSGMTEVKSYNVFLGTSASGGIATPGVKRICLNEDFEFMLTGFKYNPPWTVYTLSFNDGAKPRSFLVSDTSKDYVRMTYAFNSFPKTRRPKNTFPYEDRPFYTLDLVVENPCGSASARIEPFFVSDCKK